MSVAWFIDGAYALKCWRSVSQHGQVMDYAKFRGEIEDDAKDQIIEAYYFGSDNDPPSTQQDGFHTAISQPPPRGAGLRVKLYWLSTQKLKWPAGLGGGPVLHPTETGVQYELKIQKGVDVGLAFHLMRSFSKRKWDKLYLVAGDGDFHEVVQHLVENENVSVTIIGTERTISSELAPYASNVVYFDDIVGQIAR